MKPFTDKDLKRLKGIYEWGKPGSASIDDIASLIARLEAAENVCEFVVAFPNQISQRFVNEWRERAGRTE